MQDENFMTHDDDTPAQKTREGKILSPAAKRALAEAKARKEQYQALEDNLPPEQGGRGGKEPARYGDWEIKGIAVDF